MHTHKDKQVYTRDFRISGDRSLETSRACLERETKSGEAKNFRLAFPSPMMEIESIASLTSASGNKSKFAKIPNTRREYVANRVSSKSFVISYTHVYIHTFYVFLIASAINVGQTIKNKNNNNKKREDRMNPLVKISHPSRRKNETKKNLGLIGETFSGMDARGDRLGDNFFFFDRLQR